MHWQRARRYYAALHHGASGVRWILLALVVTSAATGDLLQSYAMKQGEPPAGGMRGLSDLLKRIWKRRLLIVSIASMAISFFAFLALVRREPLSFAVPASAATFVIEMVVAKFALREKVGARRVAAALCVLAGIVLIAR